MKWTEWHLHAPNNSRLYLQSYKSVIHLTKHFLASRLKHMTARKGNGHILIRAYGEDAAAALLHHAPQILDLLCQQLQTDSLQTTFRKGFSMVVADSPPTSYRINQLMPYAEPDTLRSLWQNYQTAPEPLHDLLRDAVIRDLTRQANTMGITLPDLTIQDMKINNIHERFVYHDKRMPVFTDVRFVLPFELRGDWQVGRFSVYQKIGNLKVAEQADQRTTVGKQKVNKQKVNKQNGSKRSKEPTELQIAQAQQKLADSLDRLQALFQRNTSAQTDDPAPVSAGPRPG